MLDTFHHRVHGRAEQIHIQSVLLTAGAMILMVLVIVILIFGVFVTRAS